MEHQTLDWEPPIMPPCLCPGTYSPEEDKAGTVTPSLELALECGARAQAILRPILTLLFLISISGT